MEKISEFTIRRLSSYYRILLDLENKSNTTVSSAKLADLCSVTSAQVRKDLSYFGNFGTRGLGYQVSELKGAIEQILGLNKKWTMALFGAGSLGHALFFHHGFREDGFYFEHIFDVDPKKVGERWETVEIRPVDEARERIKAGVLNFAPKQLNVPKRVRLRNVNLAVALESLSFFLSR
jgi:redox-sensing transcriptional repressor